MDQPLPPPSAPPDTRSRRLIWTARGLALAADALQIALFPLFGEGFASPLDLALDAGMALALTKLVGFHWSYLPTTALELVPGADLAPTWTAAALLATSGTGSLMKKAVWIGLGVLAFAILMVAILIRQWPGR